MKQAVDTAETGLIELGGEAVAYKVIRSRKRRRSIAFKVERDASLYVMAPVSASLRSILGVLHKRAAWIVKERAKRRAAPVIDGFVDGAAFVYLGYRCALRVTRGAQAPPSCRLARRVFHIHVPSESLTDEHLRDEVRLEISLWLKRRARAKFRRRLDLWAQRLDVRCQKLVVTDPERRWGSCSADNVIRLNWRLMLLPLPILDYVVAHELCHVRHKDHSARFWNFLARAMPDYKERRKALRGLEGGII